MDLVDVVHLALHHLVPKGTTAKREAFVDELDTKLRHDERIQRSKRRQRFRLAPAGPDGRGR